MGDGGLVRVRRARRRAARSRSSSRAVAATAESAGLRETIAFIWGDPALRALFVFPTAAVLLVGPLVPIVLPVLARQAFGDPVVLGVMVASYGAGGLLGAAGFGMFGSRVPRRRLYGGIFVVWPCTYAAITLVPFLPFTLAMLLTLGAAAGSLVPLQATIRQERSPARLLPRVVGLSTASIPVAAPIGVLVAGFLIDGLGLHQTLLLMTAGAALIGATVLTSRDPRLRLERGHSAGRWSPDGSSRGRRRVIRDLVPVAESSRSAHRRDSNARRHRPSTRRSRAASTRCTAASGDSRTSACQRMASRRSSRCRITIAYSRVAATRASRLNAFTKSGMAARYSRADKLPRSDRATGPGDEPCPCRESTAL